MLSHTQFHRSITSSWHGGRPPQSLGAVTRCSQPSRSASKSSSPTSTLAPFAAAESNTQSAHRPARHPTGVNDPGQMWAGAARDSRRASMWRVSVHRNMAGGRVSSPRPRLRNQTASTATTATSSPTQHSDRPLPAPSPSAVLHRVTAHIDQRAGSDRSNTQPSQPSQPWDKEGWDGNRQQMAVRAQGLFTLPSTAPSRPGGSASWPRPLSAALPPPALALAAALCRRRRWPCTRPNELLLNPMRH